jgi:hypothetical protein
MKKVQAALNINPELLLMLAGVHVMPKCKETHDP